MVGVAAITPKVRDFHERLMRRLTLRCYFKEMEVDKVIQHHIHYVFCANCKTRIQNKKMYDQHTQASVIKVFYNQTLEIFFSVLRQRQAGRRL
jgi:hypothetical protein